MPRRAAQHRNAPMPSSSLMMWGALGAGTAAMAGLYVALKMGAAVQTPSDARGAAQAKHTPKSDDNAPQKQASSSLKSSADSVGSNSILGSLAPSRVRAVAGMLTRNLRCLGDCIRPSKQKKQPDAAKGVPSNSSPLARAGYMALLAVTEGMMLHNNPIEGTALPLAVQAVLCVTLFVASSGGRKYSSVVDSMLWFIVLMTFLHNLAIIIYSEPHGGEIYSDKNDSNFFCSTGNLENIDALARNAVNLCEKGPSIVRLQGALRDGLTQFIPSYTSLFNALSAAGSYCWSAASNNISSALTQNAAQNSTKKEKPPNATQGGKNN